MLELGYSFLAGSLVGTVFWAIVGPLFPTWVYHVVLRIPCVSAADYDKPAKEICDTSIPATPNAFVMDVSRCGDDHREPDPSHVSVVVASEGKVLLAPIQTQHMDSFSMTEDDADFPDRLKSSHFSETTRASPFTTIEPYKSSRGIHFNRGPVVLQTPRLFTGSAVDCHEEASLPPTGAVASNKRCFYHAATTQHPLGHNGDLNMERPLKRRRIAIR